MNLLSDVTMLRIYLKLIKLNKSIVIKNKNYSNPKLIENKKEKEYPMMINKKC